MDQDEIESRLRGTIGQPCSITFDGHTEWLTVLLLDADGFLCRAQSSTSGEAPSEFWIAYKDVTAIADLTE